MTQAYYTDEHNQFVIEHYNDRTPFASFLPGIAGVTGRPAWVFYVNRGQGISSFGVRNKDGAFLEFFPADKAYQITQSRGFRSFLKISDQQGMTTHEPFQRGAGDSVQQRMYITTDEVGVEEINPLLGISIRADMFTLPESPLAGLVRQVRITNTADYARRIDIVDGLPQVLPFAMNQWIVKFMSRTSEAFMRVEGVVERLPLFRLKVWPTDTPQVEPVVAGNFFVGLLNGQRNQVLVDPERVFGLAGDFSQPENFFTKPQLNFERQVLANQNPAAFQYLSLELQPGESQVFYGVYGHTPSEQVLNQCMQEIVQPGYFDAKRQTNRQLLESISQRAFTATAKPQFDAHAKQCYLDNGLRGGFSMPVPGGKRLYLFGRKHGDLERDYNDFLLQDTPFSEGNGDFRDVLQNRRMDVFFDPALDAQNIRYFFNLIQPDGHNPCSLRNSRFSLVDPQQFAPYFRRFVGLEALLAREFKYAELWQLLAVDEDDSQALLTEILSHAEDIEDAEFDRGYWSDHWTYLVDLLISYQAVFPERLPGLFQEKTYSFFDSTHAVLPRSQKYVLTPQGVRQFGAVEFRPEKMALIESRPQRRFQVRDQAGQGDIIYTSLLGKILTLVTNKLAALDPFGVGIEMDADRPGWCDALNGLPGILGSSVNETIELKRLVDFTFHNLGLDNEVSLPAELAEFVCELRALLDRSDLTADVFWRESGDKRQAYRDKVFMGFAGAETTLSLQAVSDFLSNVSGYLDKAIDKARTPQGIVTYFAYEAEQYQEIGEGRVDVSCFKQKPLPLFLEGFVHALRIADPQQARELYTAVQASELYDRKLGMYRVNEPLGEQALELGRIGVFNYGWLENGSIFLHMHYKFVLEMLRASLVDEFYQNMEQLLVAFREPNQYARNPVENSSFLVSSGFAIDPRQHGRGCVARLSGSTVEFLHLWTYLFLGPKPFEVDGGELCFKPEPVLHSSLFLTQSQSIKSFELEHSLPADSAACALLGSTLLVYLNPQRKNTYGADSVAPGRFYLHGLDDTIQTVEGNCVRTETAEAIRRGEFRRVDIELT
ncbi:MAG: hypothetical protein CTY19_13110 [Methylomonas sp.]|nr:MAG: hypothetical protein CTY19_13110 [Methylomonas sp.]